MNLSPSTKAAFSNFAKDHPGIELALTEATEPKALVIRVGGDLDTGNSAAFLRLAQEVLEPAKEIGGLAIELSGLRYISSTGVGVLATLLTDSSKKGLPFMLCSVPQSAKSIFEVLGLWSFFTTVDGMKERV
jgi:anti-anti-sigma factor